MRLVGRLKAVVRTKSGRVTICFALLTFLAVIVFRNFLFTNEWPGGGDVLGWISRSYLFGKDFRWVYVWHPYSFGFVEGINSLDFFLLLIYIVCHDASCAIKVFMFSSFLTAGFLMYAFAYRYTHKHLAALSASMIYTLNQWVFSQFTEAHIDIAFSYALAPLLFLLLDKALDTRKFKDILILALGLSVFVTGFHPESIVIYGIFLAIFIVFRTLIPMKPENFSRRIKNLLKVCLPVGATCFLLSAFSLLPFLSNVRAFYYSPAYRYPLEDTRFLSYTNVADAFTLRAVEDFGYKTVVDIPEGLSLPDFPITAFLLFLFSLAYCTIFLRRDRYTAFFVTAALISTFISKGPYPRFGYVFTWAWFNVPHFAVFRAANRWAMMTAFSNAFFISVLVSILTGYVKKKRYLRMSEIPLRAKTEILSEHPQAKEICVSLDILNRFIKKLHKFLHYFSLGLLIAIFLTGFLSSWFFFSQGLQVYTPPQSYLEPYEWIGEQPGDYKIVTVSELSDFAHGGMTTELGWGHDIGWDSSFIHDKPTLQNGGWEALSRDFVNYLRFQVVPQNMTDDLLKMLGTLNYKYIVLPPYAAANTRDFFLNQQGGHVIYNQSSVILENEFYTPRISATTEHAVVIGGLESLFSLSKMDSSIFSEIPLIFAHQMNGNPVVAESLFNNSKALIFVDTDMLDLTMLSLKEDVYLINAAEYGVPSLNATEYWISDPWKGIGEFVLSGNMLSTRGDNDCNIPFTVEREGVYDIWARIGMASNRGKLTVSVDGVTEREIRASSNFWSRFMWINITRSYLSSGGHTITLSNDGTGYNDIDTIMIVSPSVFEQRASEMLHALEGFMGRLIFTLEAENVLTYNPGYWSLALRPFDGIVLHTEGMGLNVSPNGTASASSVSGGLTVQGAIDGDMKTRWASLSGLPVWFQVNWTTPQELMGVRLFFEWAYAEDYVIQTWDGSNWIDQVKVKGNTLLERFHSFKQPVQTKKLRIYVTSAPVMDLVSIWELESYTTEGVDASAETFIPREGNYVLAARLASNTSDGTLKVKINDFTTTMSYSRSTDFEWYESSPFSLDVGDQTINISSAHEVDIDKIAIYSLEEGETAVPLNYLFESDSTRPTVNYEKVNPCKYIVHVNSSEPFLLVFSEAYHPMWKAYINNVEVSSTIAYSCVNAFFINKTGEFNITLYFTGQIYANIGIGISVITLSGTIVALCIQSKRLRKLKKYIEQKKR